MSEFSEQDEQLLLKLAYDSIDHGLATQQALKVRLTDFPPQLSNIRACFVTIEKNGQLRGCIGSLKAHQALVKDVAQNAFKAAFNDPRFPPLSSKERDQIDCHISVLSEPQVFPVTSEENLLTTIRPGIDGLILQEAAYSATFLPSVWESLPQPKEFLAHLKQKAGLPANYWSDSMRFWRYQSHMIE